MALNTRSGCLILEDGSVFPGYLHNLLKHGDVMAEAVFNTAMSGYEEVVTDPSYLGQIVVMTAPHQGNYGINLEDAESGAAHLSGFVVREFCDVPSNWRSKVSLGDFLAHEGVAVLSGVDTRTLTLKLRRTGCLRAMITAGLAPVAPASRTFSSGKSATAPAGAPSQAWVERKLRALKTHPQMQGSALAQEVSVNRVSLWQRDRLAPLGGMPTGAVAAVWDFGVKWGILRQIEALGLTPVVFPIGSTAEEILACNPDAIVLSNGPGDPAALHSAIEQAARLLAVKNRPWILGICLGHQILALACGAKTYKMTFGHRGVNHPVKDIATGRVLITSHNHGFAVDAKTLPAGVATAYVSLNDDTLEGMFSQERRFISTQFHPESSPGPHEARGIFAQFQGMLSKESLSSSFRNLRSRYPESSSLNDLDSGFRRNDEQGGD